MIELVWSYILVVWLLMGERMMEFNFIQTILIAVAPAAITGIVTYVAAKSSQLKDNTAELKKLNERLGLSEEQTLWKQIASGFEVISNDIGRKDDSSLTKQHRQIEANIEKSFGMIQQRYDKEDARYRKLTLQQYDLKKILDGFSRDYLEQISQVDELTKKNETLLQKVTVLSTQNDMLKSINERLQEENDMLKNAFPEQEFDDELEI